MNFKPDGYHSLTPYLIMRDAAKAIEFYKKVFGAEEHMRMGTPDGKIGHAEIKIGDSVVMLADECSEGKSPQTLGGSAVGLMFYLPDVDATVKLAVAEGATLQRPVEDQFYGDRSGSIADPFGHVWHLATHVEDVSPEEMEKRQAEAAKKAVASTK
jgi:PhnB protein